MFKIIPVFREILNENNDNEVTELDTEKFVPIAVECLAILIKLNDTIEVRANIALFINLLNFIKICCIIFKKLKSTMQTQLVEIVEKATKQISTANKSKNSGEQLVALVNSVILQFYSVVDAHQLFLDSLDKVIDQKLLVKINKYDLKYVWENIESIVSKILIFKNNLLVSFSFFKDINITIIELSLHIIIYYITKIYFSHTKISL